MHTCVMFHAEDVAQFMGKGAPSWASRARSVLHKSNGCTPTHGVQIGYTNSVAREVLASVE